MKNRIVLEVNLQTLAENYRKIAVKVNPAEVLCVVKADAYGLGAAGYVKALSKAGCRQFGVAEPREALEVMKHAKGEVQVLSAVLPDEIDSMVKAGVILPIVDREAAKLISAAAKRARKVAKVHFKLDTGMGRLGILADREELIPDVIETFRFVRSLPNLDCEGVFSHFPVASDPKDSFTKRQIGLFKKIIAAAKAAGIVFKKVHIAASDAINFFPEAAKAPFTQVRAGIDLHGSFDASGIRRIKVEPTISLKVRVAQVRELPKGKTLGYGRTWQLSAPSRIATLAAGYADGLPLALTNRGEVLVNGVRCPIVGRISMDYTTVDVSKAGKVAPGDYVTLFGGSGRQAISPADWAALKGTHAYDILCSLSPRVVRKQV